MSVTVQFSCKCGQVTGEVTGVTPKNSAQLACSCKHCKAFAAYLGDADRMFANGRVDLLQTQPWLINFKTGEGNLANLRLTQKGPLRWYATCCDTPLCNTLTGRFPPFASLMAANFTGKQDILPYSLHAFCNHVPEDQRVAPAKGRAMLAFVFKFLGRVCQGLPTRFRRNPFFNEDGAPLSAPVPLEADRKAAAYQA